MPATRNDCTFALVVVVISAVLFASAVPFAGVPLTPIPAFVASYQSALAINDLITAVLLYSQFTISRSRGLLLLASGYLFTATAAVVHALTFPGLFAPGGLLGSGTQTTVWLYMVWHGVFPLMVLAYALLKARDGEPKVGGSARTAVVASIVAVGAAMALFTWVVTAQHDRLPILLSGGHYTPIMLGVVSTVWGLSLAALAVLWLRRPYSVLDVWLMVVMSAWLFDIALSAILNVARFDVGFYLGRIYGLCAASFVLAVLLVDNVGLQAKLARLLGTSRTESRRTEQALSQEMEERRRIFESSNDLILVSDSVGNLIQVSPSVTDILGYQPSEMVGHNAIKFIHPDDLEHTRKEMRAGRRGKNKRNFETRYISKDGKPVALNWTGTWSEPVRRHFFIGRDLTEKQAAEAQLRHAQKMDAVGQLTGGVAHDFNNILTVITGTIGILEEAVADQPQLAAVAKMIDEAAERGANLTKHLLAFARKQPLQPVEVDVNALVLEAAKLLHPTLGEQIEITPLLADDAWTALADPSQLTTAVLNLAINARDAMPGGGKLALETSNVYLDESYAGMHSEVTPGHYVMIAVSDTGSGIPPALLDRVFEPFFTTKEVGRGTGLGLSMVFGFVKQSGGHIKIYSEQGHGTSVKIYLPRATGLQQTAAEAQVAANLEGGNETVLVVEDDALVRRYVMTQIESLGYKTLEAANASDALRIIEGISTVDLLFTDVIMPGPMNGRQLVDEALKRRPGLKTLYTSGYTENAIVHHGRLDSGVLLLAKPYRKAELARMIRLALAS
ncbi:MASE4 domain-containing protein [Bradyrhizobium archetypum]|uniref:histidine kinase n=1 Tax=Bradyrhizobium archetypum TaxID=2721160 RepID=A0A7Y4M1A1_9BRAD|nr:MASE4 domain-containing protein [Bradyrhizobium archetypum]NOJ46169.1 PAS domain S-box protein [Bradyrhizobium archetypum]